MKSHGAAALLAAALSFPGIVAAMPSRPEGPVADLAGILDAQTIGVLDGLIRQTQEKNGAVLVVATVPSLEGMTVEDYTNRLFKAWGIGEKGKNNGILLLVAPTEHKVRIEVGYGLEGVLPDGRCGEIIRAEIVPAFKRGAPAEGVLAGARAIAGVIGGDATAPITEQPGGTEGPDSLMPLVGILILAVSAFAAGLLFGFHERGHRWALVLCVASLIPALYGAYLALKFLGSHLFYALLPAIPGEHIGSGRINRPSRRGGGWSSGGFGGWSGGGSGFGGGGGGFGGFGGGSSGGGGASGSW